VGSKGEKSFQTSYAGSIPVARSENAPHMAFLLVTDLSSQRRVSRPVPHTRRFAPSRSRAEVFASSLP
jgi:hypothetical protein